MLKPVCPECRKVTEVVVDHAAGDTVCTECGLVLEDHLVDDSYEWRTFSESTENDPVRVGGPSNLLLTDNNLSTFISKPNGAQGNSLMSSTKQWQNRDSNPEGLLKIAFNTIDSMAYRLSLVSTITFRSKEIYKKLEDLKSKRGRRQDPILAACLYIACRQEDKPRTFKEICSVTNGASKGEISKAVKFIQKQLGIESMESMGTIHGGDFMRRFCSHLGMENNEVRAATETVKKAEIMLDIRKSPISVAAAAIYIISQLNEKGNKPTLKDVSRAAGVAEVTLRSSYKDLYPHAAKIIPDWFLKKVNLKNMPAP